MLMIARAIILGPHPLNRSSKVIESETKKMVENVHYDRFLNLF